MFGTRKYIVAISFTLLVGLVLWTFHRNISPTTDICQSPEFSRDEKLQMEYSKTVNAVAPSVDYQQKQQRIRINTLEMYDFMSSELAKIKENVNKSTRQEIDLRIEAVIAMVAERTHSLTNDIDGLRKIDGYAQWRNNELENLSDLVQRRLKALQNPADCSKAKKITGFGSELHNIMYGLLMAYVTERTLIVESKGWHYNAGGWEEIFQPVSETCTSADGLTRAEWTYAEQFTAIQDNQVLLLPPPTHKRPVPPQHPLAIPIDLAPQITRAHGNPAVWWIGQFVKYLFRFQPETEAIIESRSKKLGFRKPIVGIHIRRTDKLIKDAAFHGVDEYMKWVEDFYDRLEMRELMQPYDKRRIFLATDEPTAIDDILKKYPNYEVIYDRKSAEKASVSTRASALHDIIFDIHLLSLSDYVVCTLSSNVCQRVYDLIQGRNSNSIVEPWNRVKSLDHTYGFFGQRPHKFRVVLPHSPKNNGEILLEVNDIIELGPLGNKKNGYFEGRNTRSGQKGLFPSFKVVEWIETAEFPTYPNVSLKFA